MSKEQKRPSVIQRPYELPTIIRPPMDKDVTHCPEHSTVRDIRSLGGEKSYNSTHIIVSVPLRKGLTVTILVRNPKLEAGSSSVKSLLTSLVTSGVALTQRDSQKVIPDAFEPNE